MTAYTLIEAVSDQILRLDSRFGPQVWTRVRLRKRSKCATGCRRSTWKGEHAYRPITHGKNRRHRICLLCSWRLREEGRDVRQNRRKRS